ncbi:alpha/beta fold hydrolase [Nitriliruptor alkaliphilus]|uniref:alpha/beta fold hydrolase n=1 Tax=Nitriliruptor alkaliphilus TaxID=427918 RepID=UPI00069789AC|nr:alpha/beta fold hydrolase [Nitriliruptor alkaliphilus]
MTTVEARTARRLRRDDPLDEVRSSFLRLAERFDRAGAGSLHATFVVDVAGRGPTTVAIQDARCFVSPGAAHEPDAHLATDPATWLDLVEGRVDGIAAFLAGRLVVEGDLALAARFETLFAPAPGATRVLRTRHTDVRGVRIESIVAGSGDTPVLLLHGLGASKVSFLPTLDGLAGDRFEVHALDLPGFGKSDKPLPAGRRYSMAWMADAVHGYLIRNEIRDAHVIGNSMGGRVATELALRHPGSVRSVVGLGSAVAFDEYRRLAPLLRLTRPQYLAAAPLRLRRTWVEAGLRELFHDPSRVPEANYRAAASDVMLSLRDPGYRMALASCARSLGMEKGRGRTSYWTRLASCNVPTYWIFGRHDRLVRHGYADRVRTALPAARVEMWHDCGHVPQFEHPDRVTDRVTSWLGRIEAGR